MSERLRSRYLGLDITSPLVASASPLTGQFESLEQLAQAGIGAVVLPSLFEEQIEHEEGRVAHLHDFGADAFPEALDYFPELESYNTGPDRYLRTIEEAKQRLDVPVIASLNGSTRGGWVRYATMMQEAGADAIELNVYFVPTDPTVDGQAVETRYVELVEAVRPAISIPLSVKIAHAFTAPVNFALRLVQAGADGLVLFNRILRPRLDLESMQLVPHLELSTPTELLRSQLWIGILRDHTTASLAGSGGVHEPEAALRLLMVGADVAMTTSALLQHGAGHVRELLDGMLTWLDANEYESVDQLRGSMSYANCPDPTAYERANYMRTLAFWTSQPI